jgi:hypothetical protein
VTTAKAPGAPRRAGRIARGSGSQDGEQGRSRVVSLDARRIENALRRRARYKYVHPHVVGEGTGWKVVSPNCSRNIDADGGEIDIAWLLPDAEAGLWQLFSRDHAQACWTLQRRRQTLAALLEHLCTDPEREFWQ